MFWENRGSAYEFSGQSWLGFLPEVDLGVLSPSCEIGMAVQCWCLGTMLRSRGLWGRGPGRLLSNRPCFRMALCQPGVMCRWFAGVSFPWMRRLTIVYLHRGVPSAVSLGCLGALSVPEPPPKRQVICECDRFFRWSCILNRTDVLLIHGWRRRSRPSG